MDGNKKLCPVCGGFMKLKLAAPQFVGSGKLLRVSGVRVFQECPLCDLALTRRMDVIEFKDYIEVMKALGVTRSISEI